MVGLDLADRSEYRPIKAEPGGRVAIEGEVAGGDIGDRRRRVGNVGRGERRPLAGQDPDRPEDDEQADEGDRAARRRAAAPGPPHDVSGGANLEWDWPTRSAGRVVKAAYSRRLTRASKATWLRPTNRRPSPGRA